MTVNPDNLKFDERGLIPAVVQDVKTREVLTLAYMSLASLKRTVETKETWFWSRSRNELWHKGETSGNTQKVVDILTDCDGDALIVLVEPTGPACHKNETSCFHNPANTHENLGAVLDQLYALVEERERERPEKSYTTYLFNEGLDKILKKVGEESAETIIAAKNESLGPLVAEVSDLLYHLIVLLVARGVSLDQIQQELSKRRAAR
ncbi:MAG TPA: bifunctional phosphoribosyl-AMP cyclohydrolase/phosphoribosyl-ATP diphosphatase HisIE [Pyrinomonadaceae bacterium]